MIILALGALFSSHAHVNGTKSETLTQSQAFYRAARDRIGTLEPDLLSVQALFFLGIYELHAAEPLAAWKWLSQASSFLLLHLKAKEAYLKRNPTYSQNAEMEKLEASLYWSCYKVMW